jgi:hypothetical protein
VFAEFEEGPNLVGSRGLLFVTKDLELGNPGTKLSFVMLICPSAGLATVQHYIYKGIASIHLLVVSTNTMQIHSSLVFFLSVVLQLDTSSAANNTRCRNVPGSPGFPSVAQWNALNHSISGRLTSVVPSAKFCHELPSGSCTDAQWESSTFRDMIPGAMNYVRF